MPKVSLSESFEVRQVIGVGTFSRVRLARHRGSGFVYAVKSLAKSEQVRLGVCHRLGNEIKCMRLLDHRNIAKFVSVFQDSAELHIVQECVSGGEIFTHVNHRTSHRTSEEVVVFYASQIALAFEHMHSKRIVFRDLRQENLCVAANGYIKLVDFGNARLLRVGRRARTLCGAPEYSAPEMLSSRGHSFEVDWWALGVLLYELLVGWSPFYSENPMDIYARILARDQTLRWPENAEIELGERARVSNAAKLAVEELLTIDDLRRPGFREICEASLFAGVNWLEIRRQSIQPPLKAFVPKLSSSLDVGNFEMYDQSKTLPAQPLKSAKSKMEWRRWCSRF